MKLTPIQKRIFLGSFVAMFLVVMMNHFQISPSSLISPVPDKTNIMDTIRPMLEEKRNTFHLVENHHFIPQAGAAGEYEQAKSYAVIDLDTGTIIKEKALTKEVPIASLTKIMTAVVAMDLASPDEHFSVSETAAKQIPTKIGVIPGEKLSLKELIEAAMLTSANDGVQVISDGIDEKYGENVFVRAMNEKASFLGLSETHFTNPQGFDNPEHYSSAGDLAVLTQYALTNYPLFAETVKKDYIFLPEDANHKQFDLYNWNGLLGVYPNIYGVKIGNTDDAGKTTLVASRRNGKSLLVVVLGAPGIIERDLWASQLLDEGFKEVQGLEPIQVTEEQLREKYQSWQYFH